MAQFWTKRLFFSFYRNFECLRKNLDRWKSRWFFVDFSWFCSFAFRLYLFLIEFCRFPRFIRLQPVFVVKWIFFRKIYSSWILKTVFPCSGRDSNSRPRGKSYISNRVWIKWGIWRGRETALGWIEWYQLPLFEIQGLWAARFCGGINVGVA